MDSTNNLRDHSFDNLSSSAIRSFSNTHIHDILVIIGLLTICLILFILLIQFFVKIRQIYRTSEPKQRYKKSSHHRNKCLATDNYQCKCFQYSCLPTFQCVKTTSKILNQSLYYEQIDERQMNNSIYQVFIPHNTSSCIRIHTVK